jgi:hypothetical protein
MPTLQTQSTKGAPVTVIYPAESPASQSVLVRFRLGKKSMLPAYSYANLPHLVQFQIGQQIVTFMLNDILETSYWRKIRNAYNVLGQLDIDEDAKVGIEECERVNQWLREQSIACGVSLATVA